MGETLLTSPARLSSAVGRQRILVSVFLLTGRDLKADGEGQITFAVADKSIAAETDVDGRLHRQLRPRVMPAMSQAVATPALAMARSTAERWVHAIAVR